MPDRKSTPDILAEILVGAAPSDEMQVEPPILTPPRKKRSSPARPAETETPKARPAARPAVPNRWNYLVISFQDHRGWRARFRDGVELTDWTGGPLLHETLTQLAQDGWELVTATSGEALYGAADKRQLYFRRAAG